MATTATLDWAAELGAEPVAGTGEADTPVEPTLRFTETAVAGGRFRGSPAATLPGAHVVNGTTAGVGGPREHQGGEGALHEPAGNAMARL